jgi:Ras-related protein Rab-7A
MEERVCKLLVLGDPGVGKTALFKRITEGSFCEEGISTLGADFATTIWPVGDETVSLQIWDTAGQERFHAIGNAFYRGTDACMIVFDLTRKETFQHVTLWREGLEQKIGTNHPHDFPLLLIGNKFDLAESREVNSDEAMTFGTSHGFSYFEVSAKTQENIGNALDELARRFVESSKNDVFQVIHPERGSLEWNQSGLRCC